MSNYSIPVAEQTTFSPTDIIQQFCHECTGFDVDKSRVWVKTCNHDLRLLPKELEIYEILQGFWRPPSNFPISPMETILPASSVSLTSAHRTPPSPRSPQCIPLPESGEESESEGEEEGGPEDDAHVVEQQEAAEHGGDEYPDDWGAEPAVLRTRNGRAAVLQGTTPRLPSTIDDEASTRESSPLVATGDEDGDYSTDSEIDGTFDEDYCNGDPDISDGEVTGDTAEGIQASEGDEQRTTKSEEDYDPNTEGDDFEMAPTQLGSRDRPKRAREIWQTKRGKPMVPAAAEDLAGYPAPADVFRTILNSGKFWVKAADAEFPMEQRVIVTERREKEDWECRLKLAIPRTGDVRWMYNPVACPKALNRDGYLRHLLDSHLGVERASGGSTRQDQIKKALKRCIAAYPATRRGKRDREDDPEPGPSRKRMREN